MKEIAKLGAALGMILAGVAGLSGADERPNILFIFSDDHSLQAISAYEGRMAEFIREQGVVPNIDRLAKEGALFVNSFVCNSICGPSRAAILTGKHSQHNGFYRNGQRFNPDQWTFPQVLQESGYDTAIFGKWHLGTAPRGFDRSMVLQGQGFYYNPDFFVDGSRRLTRVEGYVSDIVADETIEWLENREDKEKPFFLCSWHKAPHRTWLPAERHFHFLDKVEVPEPDNLFDSYGGNRNSNLKRQTMTVATELNMAYDLKVTPPVARTEMEAFWEGVEQTESMDRTTRAEFARMDDWQRQVWDTYYEPRNQAVKAMGLEGEDLVRWKYQAYMKDYLRCIKAMDENIGRVLTYLEESGLAENTIVIYSSDQGFYNGEHGWYDKRWMYEESMRNPLIIRWPGKVAPGQRLEQLVQNIDYAPTLLDIAGVEVPEAVQGSSFKPVLLGEPVDWRKSLLYTYYERGIHDVAMHYGVRDERYKLIHFPETGEWELFDLKTDPAEMHNHYDNPFFSGQVKRLKRELDHLMQTYQVEDPLQHVLKEQQS